MATTDKSNRNPISRVRDQFRDVVATFDATMPPAVAQAMRSLLTALEYEDRPLIRSHLETAFAAMTEAVGEAIGKRLDWSRTVRAHYHRLAVEVGGSPGEEFDEVGRAVGNELDKIIRVLKDMRDGPVRDMNEAGVEVPGEKALQDEIREMDSFRASLIGEWPWSALPLPASDPAMLARARVQSKGGQGVPIEDLIRKIETGD